MVGPFFLIIFVCVIILSAYITVLHMYFVPIKARNGHRIPWSWIYRQFWETCGYWELNPCLLQEQQVLIKAGLFLKPQGLAICKLSADTWSYCEFMITMTGSCLEDRICSPSPCYLLPGSFSIFTLSFMMFSEPWRKRFKYCI